MAKQRNSERETVVAEGRSWVKVAAPQPWRPQVFGDCLVGTFMSRSTRPGDGGKVYGVVTIQTEAGAFSVAGVVITSLFEAAGCAPGALVRIVFRGNKNSQAGRWYRDYDLFLAEDEMEER